jgi:hypothetical protein
MKLKGHTDNVKVSCFFTWINYDSFPTCSLVKWDQAQLLERLTANAEVGTDLGSIPASADTVESEVRKMKQYLKKYI